MMKKYFTILMISVFVVIGGMAKAQLVKQKAKVEEKKQSDRDWVNSSFEKDGVYGACVNDAYEFLKGKKAKVRPIVALIGTGVDLEHEALKANVPVLIDCQIDCDDKVWPMVAPGKAISDAIDEDDMK